MASAALLASKIITQEEEPQLRAIPATATAVIGLVGVAERGPLAEPTLCQSWEDYRKVFGGFTADADMTMAAYLIWKEDPTAWVYACRTVHYTDPATPATKTSAAATIDMDGTTAVASSGAVTGSIAGPWNLEPGQTLDIHVDEDIGGPDTATFDAAAAVAAGSGLAIVDLTGDTLILELNNDGDTQTITFSGAEATAADVAATINAHLRGGHAEVNTGEVDIYSDLRGTDSEVDITGGTGLTEIGHAVGVDSGTGDVADINAVTFDEAKAVIENDVAGVTVTEHASGFLIITSDSTGVSSSVMVEVSSTADDAFGLDNTLHSGSASSTGAVLTVDGKTDGTYAHALRPTVEAASNGDADYYNFSVKTADGLLLEIYANVQQSDDTAADYVETVVNNATTGSQYLAVTALTTDRPDNGDATPAGGDDGLTSLAGTDFLGDSAGRTGLHAFDLVEDVTLLALPGRTSSAEHLGLVDYCVDTKAGMVFAVLDPPSGYTGTQIAAYMTSSGLKGYSEHGAIFWPEVKVLNPSTSIFGTDEQVEVPPSGPVLGTISRTDNARQGGVYDQPAGVERGVLKSVLGVADTTVLDQSVRDLVYPERVNPITSLRGYSRFIDGVWTLKGDGNFPTIAERRGVIYIERSLTSGLQFARHSNNDEALRRRAYRTVYGFLLQQMKAGAFRSQKPAEAFYVDFSDALNPPSVIFANKMIGRIGLATQKPAEYIVLMISQDTRALLEEFAV